MKIDDERCPTKLPATDSRDLPHVTPSVEGNKDVDALAAAYEANATRYKKEWHNSEFFHSKQPWSTR